MEKLKDLLGIAKPGGVDDVVVRAVKTGLVVFALELLRDGFTPEDLQVLGAAASAGYFAAGTVVLNALVLLLPGEAGQKTGDADEVDEDA